VSSKSKADPLPDGLHPQAEVGFRLFDQGAYYRAHDHLETAWQDTPGPHGDLYQGVLQIGIAYYHIERGKYRGALKMFQRGQVNLEPLQEQTLGLNVKQLRYEARQVEKLLRKLGPEGISQLGKKAFPPLPR